MPRLLPPDGAHGWTQYVWLIYLSAYAIYPFWVGASALVWAADAAGLVAFLALYFRGYWVDGARRLPVIAGLAVLGAALAPVNPGALTFFIYAAAFIGGACAGRAATLWIIGLTVAGVGLAVLLAVVQGWRTPLEPMLIVSVIVMTPIIGFVNLHYNETRQRDAALRLAQDEIARLAARAERDRIAGDLHDLLGHTLSVIVLKSGLASKLMARDAGRAAIEIADVERISREALAEVRRAVQGFRTTTLSDELVRARGVLATAGIDLEASTALVPASGPVEHLSTEVEHAAALILRESITNVIRHSRATRCRIDVRRAHDMLHLEVADDGVGSAAADGSGTEGMRARAREIGGVLERDGSRGMTIRLTAPWTSVQDRVVQMPGLRA
jgi:two-component system sensor histidine kinase DesK